MTKIIFNACLYKSNRRDEIFNNYFETCKITIKNVKKLFSGSKFHLHVDTSITNYYLNILINIVDKIFVHTFPTLQKDYEFSLNSSAIIRRKNCDQLLKCVRLFYLFDKTIFEECDYCIIIDVHDDFTKTAKYINTFLNTEKDYMITNWKSSESECVYDSNVTEKTHFHFDAGLVITRKVLPSNSDISFEDFVTARIMKSSSRLVKGVEEMLIDEYLKSIGFYENYRDKIYTEEHSSEIDKLFYEDNSTPKRSCKKQKILKEPIRITHKPFSVEVNKLIPDFDIYICNDVN